MGDGDASPTAAAATTLTATPASSPPASLPPTPPSTSPPHTPPVPSPPPPPPPPPPPSSPDAPPFAVAPTAPPRRRSLLAGRPLPKSDTEAAVTSPNGRSVAAATPTSTAAATPGRDPDTGASSTPPSPRLVRSADAEVAATTALDTATVGLQVLGPAPCHLRVLPARGLRGGCVRMAVRVLLSQAGLATLLLAWALLGAWAFRQTEGPHERRRVASVRAQQVTLAEELAEAARQLAAAGVGVCTKAAARAAALAVTTRDADGGGGGSGGGSGDESGGGSGGGSGESEAAEEAWRTAAASYVERHEALLLEAVDDGFGEGGGGPIWTFAGCILFAVSLLTTLGFGAPVPRTTAGRISAAVFAAVGIPLHLLLALNAGALAASGLTQLAMWMQRRRRTQRREECSTSVSPPPPQPTDGWSPPGSCPCSTWRDARWPAAAAAAAAACTACGDACAAGAVACAAAAAWPCARRRDECAPAPGPQPVRQSLHAPAVAPMDGGDKAVAAAAFAVDVATMEANSLKVTASSPDNEATLDEDAPPGWLQWAPTIAAVVYYVIGVLAFGAARSRPAAACLLFPLDFTATGGVGRVDGALRALYAVYLEGAVLLAATGVAIHRVAAARGLEALGMRWGLLTNDETF